MKKLLCLLAALCLAMLPAASLAENTSGYPSDIAEITQNSTLDLEQYSGKAIFINFFTGWCGYCMEEMPDIKKVFETYSPDELQIILVHPWDAETDKETAEIIERFGLEEMTVVEDKDMRLAAYFALQGYPTSIFIGKDGNVFGLYPGSMDFETFSYVFDGLGVAKAETGE